MDWETLYCPHRHCRGYGKPFSQGYLVKNGTSRGQPRAWCTACEASVVLSYGTAYYGLEADPVVFETAVRALAEGNALRATARIVQVDKDTVCTWLHRVACHCRTVMLYFWHDLHVSECQLDELWSFVHTKEAHLPGAKLYCDTYGDAWVWIAFALVWRVVLAFVIGKREQAGADRHDGDRHGAEPALSGAGAPPGLPGAPRRGPDHRPGVPRRGGIRAGIRAAWYAQYQPTGQCHVMTNILDYGCDIQEAIDMPRGLHYEGIYQLEDGVPAATVEGLGLAWNDAHQPIEVGKRFLVTSKSLQRAGSVVERFEMIRFAR